MLCFSFEYLKSRYPTFPQQIGDFHSSVYMSVFAELVFEYAAKYCTKKHSAILYYATLDPDAIAGNYVAPQDEKVLCSFILHFDCDVE